MFVCMLRLPLGEINALSHNLINIASDEIERKDCCTCLGLMIDDKLTWSNTLTILILSCPDHCMP